MEHTPRATEFDPAHITRAAHDSLTVRRVFGEAYERNGALVIPVAKLMGGTGSGWGAGFGEMNGADGGPPPDVSGPAEQPAAEQPAAGHGRPHGHRRPPMRGQGATEGSGGGGGFGVQVRPLGVYVVDDEGVRWQPALDLNRVILGGQAVAVVLGVTLAWAARRRRRRA